MRSKCLVAAAVLHGGFVRRKSQLRAPPPPIAPAIRGARPAERRDEGSIETRGRWPPPPPGVGPWIRNVPAWTICARHRRMWRRRCKRSWRRYSIHPRCQLDPRPVVHDPIVGEFIGRLKHNPISAQELNCSTNRGLQKIIGLDPLILRCKKPLSRHNSRREFVGMPMTELRQIRQHRRIRIRIHGYVEVRLVVVFIAWRKPNADIAGCFSSPHRKRGQSRKIEVMWPAAHRRDCEFVCHHLSLNVAQR